MSPPSYTSILFFLCLSSVRHHKTVACHFLISYLSFLTHFSLSHRTAIHLPVLGLTELSSVITLVFSPCFVLPAPPLSYHSHHNYAGMLLFDLVKNIFLPLSEEHSY